MGGSTLVLTKTQRPRGSNRPEVILSERFVCVEDQEKNGGFRDAITVLQEVPKGWSLPGMLG
jgi:hypothetical protein